ncbi:hypothetical protein MKW92_012332 [Papaver armeniacum]|nr:hypothetical protein MKW92_012332 [Papaver armeniacum]
MTRPIKEAALDNIPTIAFRDTDSPIPSNCIGCLFWMVARMVLQMCGTCTQDSSGMLCNCCLQVDLFFYREPEEAKGQEVDGSGTAMPKWSVMLTAGADWTDAGVPVAGGDAVWESVSPPVDVAVIPPAAGWG